MGFVAKIPLIRIAVTFTISEIEEFFPDHSIFVRIVAVISPFLYFVSTMLVDNVAGLVVSAEMMKKVILIIYSWILSSDFQEFLAIHGCL